MWRNHLCLRFHRQHHSGELFSYLFGSPLLQIQNYFQQVTFAAPGAFFIVLTTLIWVGKWDWMLALVMFVDGNEHGLGDAANAVADSAAA